MPAPILHLGAVVLCTHAGQATPLAPFPRVTLSGQPVVTLNTPYAIAGCALTGTPTPPCVAGQVMVATLRVLAGNTPVATLASPSTTVPNGTPMLLLAAQTRVLAS